MPCPAAGRSSCGWANTWACPPGKASARDIRHGHATFHLGHHRVVLVSQSQVEREVGAYFELILPVAHPEGAPHSAHAQLRIHADRIHHVVDKSVRVSAGVSGDSFADARIVQSNSLDVDSDFEGVAA